MKPPCRIRLGTAARGSYALQSIYNTIREGKGKRYVIGYLHREKLHSSRLGRQQETFCKRGYSMAEGTCGKAAAYTDRCVPISTTREVGMLKNVEAFQALLLKKTKRALRHGRMTGFSAAGRMVSRPR